MLAVFGPELIGSLQVLPATVGHLARPVVHLLRVSELVRRAVQGLLGGVLQLADPLMGVSASPAQVCSALTCLLERGLGIAGAVDDTALVAIHARPPHHHGHRRLWCV